MWWKSSRSRLVADDVINEQLSLELWQTPCVKFLFRNLSCVEELWERLQRDHALSHVCKHTNGWGRHHGRGDVETRKHKSTCGGTGVRFCHSATTTLCDCHSLLWVLFGVVCLLQALKLSSTVAISATKLVLGREQIAVRSSLQMYFTQSVCCLLFCEAFLTVYACSLRLSQAEWAFTCVPRSVGPVFANAERWLRLWESQKDQVKGMKTGDPLSSPFPMDVEDEDEFCKAACIVAQALFGQTCFEWENGVCAVRSKRKK